MITASYTQIFDQKVKELGTMKLCHNLQCCSQTERSTVMGHDFKNNAIPKCLYLGQDVKPG